MLYAHIQRAAGKESGGFFRTEDGGKTWTKRGTANVQKGAIKGPEIGDTLATAMSEALTQVVKDAQLMKLLSSF